MEAVNSRLVLDACNSQLATTTRTRLRRRFLQFPPFGYDCDGNCLNDTDGDGVCDPFEMTGCQDMSACNFDSCGHRPWSMQLCLTQFRL